MQYGTSTVLTLPDTANTVVTYIRKRLGEPAIQVNMSDDQIYDRITDALQFFRDYNEDGTDKQFIAYPLTQEDLDNGWVPVANNVIEVVRVLAPTNIDKNILTDITYNMRHAINFSEFMMSSYRGYISEYNLMQMKIQEINDLFMGAKTINFNRFKNKLLWQGKMHDNFSVGDYFVYEAYILTDPEEFGGIFSDRRFLNLAYSYTKKSWGEILNKFQDIPLFGGIKLNAAKIYDEAVKDIEKYEQDIITSGTPARDFVG